ncbi:MAG TPA: 16S rRNA (guanine(966)-N(2))-methyltransferase RsmD [Steroidobacteraceae bacterium]|nr:16S rRNA (guanine(966)-N(2))-methyltransferase RsmD [Steroidobacteraceae bacterium]
MTIPSHRRGADARVLRIIGGAWRGRRLRFVSGAGIRPTPDRVRETLFNWLGPGIAGSRCLDLFAGSGALGLEALSRGAAAVTFVERDRAVARDLSQRLQEWGAVDARVAHADALAFLAPAARADVAPQARADVALPARFDIVFLDPPFADGVLAGAARLLEARGWLAPAARIYAECPVREGLPELPPNWQLQRAKRAGEVGYHLLIRSAAPT